jgi:hypothetical protein
MGRFASALSLLQRNLTGSVSLEDRVDASSCAPAAGFMTVVGGSDSEVLVDARDVLCKFLFANK